MIKNGYFKKIGNLKNETEKLQSRLFVFLFYDIIMVCYNNL